MFVSRSYEDAGGAALLPQLSLTGRSRCNSNRLGVRTSFDIATSTAAARLTVLLYAASRAASGQLRVRVGELPTARSRHFRWAKPTERGSPILLRAVRSDGALTEGTGTMAYLMTHFWPGGTEEQYQSMLTAVHPPGGLPEGQTSHVAGPTDGGYLISVVWDSKEHSERFMNGTLLPALPVDGGFAGAPEERVAEVAHLEMA